uniref:Uncharacterized protein n=1 Tax=Chromera velia CCMP2878 TaxID=1169474 RepID=A0A0G4GNZ7_9ALVE|eukprot:Cvel_4997.t1-p1 / transcript=Cvel_4997.t1 / gene=Cvel_4997 / organism=Chromera_velia_CCMP2878 / gene_product=hypothetical protein / transcript_product=hypothetical protein / location=Cvel_scaffold226:55409-62040(+) / protein_length=1878 / sequence_SO=supercontig / SO=protein_coding / is_pseudo=false
MCLCFLSSFSPLCRCFTDTSQATVFTNEVTARLDTLRAVASIGDDVYEMQAADHIKKNFSSCAAFKIKLVEQPTMEELLEELHGLRHCLQFFFEDRYEMPDDGMVFVAPRARYRTLPNHAKIFDEDNAHNQFDPPLTLRRKATSSSSSSRRRRSRSRSSDRGSNSGSNSGSVTGTGTPNPEGADVESVGGAVRDSDSCWVEVETPAVGELPSGSEGNGVVDLSAETDFPPLHASAGGAKKRGTNVHFATAFLKEESTYTHPHPHAQNPSMRQRHHRSPAPCPPRHPALLDTHAGGKENYYNNRNGGNGRKHGVPSMCGGGGRDQTGNRKVLAPAESSVNAADTQQSQQQTEGGAMKGGHGEWKGGLEGEWNGGEIKGEQGEDQDNKSGGSSPSLEADSRTVSASPHPSVPSYGNSHPSYSLCPAPMPTQRPPPKACHRPMASDLRCFTGKDCMGGGSFPVHGMNGGHEKGDGEKVRLYKPPGFPLARAGEGEASAGTSRPAEAAMSGIGLPSLGPSQSVFLRAGVRGRGDCLHESASPPPSAESNQQGPIPSDCAPESANSTAEQLTKEQRDALFWAQSGSGRADDCRPGPDPAELSVQGGDEGEETPPCRVGAVGLSSPTQAGCPSLYFSLGNDGGGHKEGIPFGTRGPHLPCPGVEEDESPLAEQEEGQGDGGGGEGEGDEVADERWAVGSSEEEEDGGPPTAAVAAVASPLPPFPIEPFPTGRESVPSQEPHPSCPPSSSFLCPSVPECFQTDGGRGGRGDVQLGEGERDGCKGEEAPTPGVPMTPEMPRACLPQGLLSESDGCLSGLSGAIPQRNKREEASLLGRESMVGGGPEFVDLDYERDGDREVHGRVPHDSFPPIPLSPDLHSCRESGLCGSGRDNAEVSLFEGGDFDGRTDHHINVGGEFGESEYPLRMMFNREGGRGGPAHSPTPPLLSLSLNLGAATGGISQAPLSPSHSVSLPGCGEGGAKYSLSLFPPLLCAPTAKHPSTATPPASSPRPPSSFPSFSCASAALGEAECSHSMETLMDLRVEGHRQRQHAPVQYQPPSSPSEAEFRPTPGSRGPVRVAEEEQEEGCMPMQAAVASLFRSGTQLLFDPPPSAPCSADTDTHTGSECERAAGGDGQKASKGQVVGSVPDELVATNQSLPPVRRLGEGEKTLRLEAREGRPLSVVAAEFSSSPTQNEKTEQQALEDPMRQTHAECVPLNTVTALSEQIQQVSRRDGGSRSFEGSREASPPPALLAQTDPSRGGPDPLRPLAAHQLDPPSAFPAPSDLGLPPCPPYTTNPQTVAIPLSQPESEKFEKGMAGEAEAEIENEADGRADSLGQQEKEKDLKVSLPSEESTAAATLISSRRSGRAETDPAESAAESRSEGEVETDPETPLSAAETDAALTRAFTQITEEEEETETEYRSEKGKGAESLTWGSSKDSLSNLPQTNSRSATNAPLSLGLSVLSAVNRIFCHTTGAACRNRAPSSNGRRAVQQKNKGNYSQVPPSRPPPFPESKSVPNSAASKKGGHRKRGVNGGKDGEGRVGRPSFRPVSSPHPAPARSNPPPVPPSPQSRVSPTSNAGAPPHASSSSSSSSSKGGTAGLRFRSAFGLGWAASSWAGRRLPFCSPSPHPSGPPSATRPSSDHPSCSKPSEPPDHPVVQQEGRGKPESPSQQHRAPVCARSHPYKCRGGGRKSPRGGEEVVPERSEEPPRVSLSVPLAQESGLSGESDPMRDTLIAVSLELQKAEATRLQQSEEGRGPVDTISEREWRSGCGSKHGVRSRRGVLQEHGSNRSLTRVRTHGPAETPMRGLRQHSHEEPSAPLRLPISPKVKSLPCPQPLSTPPSRSTAACSPDKKRARLERRHTIQTECERWGWSRSSDLASSDMV